MTIKPGQPAPALEVDTVGGGRWSLAAQKPEQFTMIVFYRGLHCPICRKYTAELNGMVEEFGKRGVSIIVVSTDPKARAEEAKSKWGLTNLTVGCAYRSRRHASGACISRPATDRPPPESRNRRCSPNRACSW